jgi:hypothetical protein
MDGNGKVVGAGRGAKRIREKSIAKEREGYRGRGREGGGGGGRKGGEESGLGVRKPAVSRFRKAVTIYRHLQPSWERGARTRYAL